MNQKFSVKSILFVVAAILTIALASGSRAAAQEGASASGAVNPDQTIQVVEGGPGFVSISGAAFVPENNNVIYNRGMTSVYSMDSVNRVFYASVNIPDRAIINQLVLYYYDTSPDDDLSVTFYQYALGTNIIDTLGLVSSSGNAGQGTAVLSLNDEVSNKNYTYILKAEFPADASSAIKLLGVRIDYGYSTYLSLINK